jgi:lipopolysaccharide export LptBFGC system permease protein LptF
MFSMAQFNRNNELVPIRASGISLFRTVTPLFLFSVLLTGGLILNQEILIPAMSARIRYTDSILRGGPDASFDYLDLEDDQGNNWDIPRYERGEDRIKGTLLLSAYYPENALVKVQVTAESAKWKRSHTDAVPRWHLSNGSETRYDETGRRLSAEEGNYEPRFAQDGYVVLRPGDPSPDPFRIVSDFLPVDIVPADRGILYQPSSVLRKLYASDPTRRDVAVALHGRYAFPLSNIVLLLIGLPFVLGTERKSTFAGLVICIVICAVFYGIHALCTELGKEQTLSPALAAWLPIAIFAPLGLFFFDGVRT